MADYNKMSGYPCFSSTTKVANNTACVVTITKPAAAAQQALTIYILGFIVSASAAPSATVEATLTGPTTHDGTTADTVRLEIPAAAFAPIVRDFGVHPLRIKVATDAVFTLPAIGGTTKAAVTVFYMIGPA